MVIVASGPARKVAAPFTCAIGIQGEEIVCESREHHAGSDKGNASHDVHSDATILCLMNCRQQYSRQKKSSVLWRLSALLLS